MLCYKKKRAKAIVWRWFDRGQGGMVVCKHCSIAFWELFFLGFRVRKVFTLQFYTQPRILRLIVVFSVLRVRLEMFLTFGTAFSKCVCHIWSTEMLTGWAISFWRFGQIASTLERYTDFMSGSISPSLKITLSLRQNSIFGLGRDWTAHEVHISLIE